MSETLCEGCQQPLGSGRRSHAKHHSNACRQKAYRARANASRAARRAIPKRLEDLDVTQLSAAARAATKAAWEMVDEGKTEAEIAAARGITLDDLRQEFEQLRSEWTIQALRAQLRRR